MESRPGGCIGSQRFLGDVSQLPGKNCPSASQTSLCSEKLICAWCQRYEEQLRTLRKIVAWIETITPSCKDMTDLLSQSMDRRLSLHNRLRIWLHLAICDRCARFAVHLACIRNASRSILEYAENISAARFHRIGQRTDQGTHKAEASCRAALKHLRAAPCCNCKFRRSSRGKDQQKALSEGSGFCALRLHSRRIQS